MKLLTFGAAALCIFGSSVASAEVSVTIHDGLVTVVARDATVRQILAEWARVGQARIAPEDRLGARARLTPESLQHVYCLRKSSITSARIASRSVRGS